MREDMEGMFDVIRSGLAHGLGDALDQDELAPLPLRALSHAYPSPAVAQASRGLAQATARSQEMKGDLVAARNVLAAARAAKAQVSARGRLRWRAGAHAAVYMRAPYASCGALVCERLCGSRHVHRISS